MRGIHKSTTFQMVTTIVRICLMYELLHDIIGKRDEYEISDIDGENDEEEQIEIADELQIESDWKLENISYMKCFIHQMMLRILLCSSY